MKKILTAAAVRKNVEKLRKAAEKRLDYEQLHEAEDALWGTVLKAIASGSCEDPIACAFEALKTEDIKFGRYCA